MTVEVVKAKSKAGRPKIVIDWELVQKLAHIQCTQAEIASAVGVSVGDCNLKALPRAMW